MSVEKLKNCPICGALPEINTECGYHAGKYCSSVAIYCPKCGAITSICFEDSPAMTIDGTLSRLIEQWNRQASDKVPLPADVIRLVIAARRLINLGVIETGGFGELAHAVEALISRVLYENEPSDKEKAGA